MASRIRGVVAAAKRARGESGLSWPRVIATALAAVTMAVISTRLTSVFNTLMLTGLISIGSALAAEFYRVVIKLTAEGTKKVVHEVARQTDESLSPAEEDSEADSTLLDQDGPDDQPSETKSSSTTLRGSQFVQLALVFGLVSLLTVGVSYLVARAQGGDVHNYTTIQRPLESLSDEEKQALIDIAVEAAKDNDGGLTGFQQQIATLQSQVDDLTSSNTELLATITDIREQIGTSEAKNLELETQIKQLEEQIQLLQQEATTPDPEGDPEPQG